MRYLIKLAGTFITIAIIITAMAAHAVAQGTDPQTVSQPTTTPLPAPPQVMSIPTGTQQADTADAKPEASEVLSTKGKVKLEVSASNGFGFNSIDVGKTTSGKEVKVSGGGGIGLAFTAGYGIAENLDVDVSLGGQTSNEQPVVENANASYTRGFLRATLKYLVPVRDRIRFKFGGGVGLYNGGELDVDTTKVAGGSRDIVKYDSATGGHLQGEFEGLIRNNITFVAGVRMYSVKYKADSYERNGAAIPVSALPDNVRNLKGGGTDFFMGFAIYL